MNSKQFQHQTSSPFIDRGLNSMLEIIRVNYLDPSRSMLASSSNKKAQKYSGKKRIQNKNKVQQQLPHFKVLVKYKSLLLLSYYESIKRVGLHDLINFSIFSNYFYSFLSVGFLLSKFTKRALRRYYFYDKKITSIYLLKIKI